MPNDSVDFIFSNGTFIEMKLGTIYLLANEFARVCKPGGKVAFDFIDIETKEGWKYLESSSLEFSGCFTYHCAHTIEKLFVNAGFDLQDHWQYGKSKYIVFTKVQAGQIENYDTCQ
jgi:hypothetical protein